MRHPRTAGKTNNVRQHHHIHTTRHEKKRKPTYLTNNVTSLRPPNAPRTLPHHSAASHKMTHIMPLYTRHARLGQPLRERNVQREGMEGFRGSFEIGSPSRVDETERSDGTL